MIKIYSLLIVILIFTGCGGTAKTLTIGNIDKNNKTITINDVSDTIFDIKYALIKDGWKIKIDNQTVNNKGTINGDIDVTTKTTYDTKYRMYALIQYWPRIDMPISSYSITIVDNITNEEILSISTKRQLFVEHDSESIANELIQELHKIEK